MLCSAITWLVPSSLRSSRAAASSVAVWMEGRAASLETGSDDRIYGRERSADDASDIEPEATDATRDADHLLGERLLRQVEDALNIGALLVPGSSAVKVRGDVGKAAIVWAVDMARARSEAAPNTEGQRHGIDAKRIVQLLSRLQPQGP